MGKRLHQFENDSQRSVHPSVSLFCYTKQEFPLLAAVRHRRAHYRLFHRKAQSWFSPPL